MSAGKPPGLGKPPPPYSGPPPPYVPPQGMSYPGGPNPGEAAPVGYGPPPGAPLYPDLSQLPQPEAVPYEFAPSSVSPHEGPGTPPPYQRAPAYPGEPLYPTAPPHEGDKPQQFLPPVRPAPPPPNHPATTPSQPDQNQIASPGQPQRPPRLRDNEVPTGCGVSWQGAAGLWLYFLQQEGQVVCHHKLLSLTIYKKLGDTGAQVEEGLLGMVEVPGCWKLRLREGETYVLHTHPNTYVFLDHSTQPQQVVVLVLPQDISTTMLQDLMVLLQEMTQLKDEKEARTVDKLTTGVSTVYTDLTKKLNTAVRDKVPGAHANTKWLRKGAGSVVRLGGSLVAKGAHLIADQVAPAPQQEEESPVHCQLMEMMATLRKKLEADDITYV